MKNLSKFTGKNLCYGILSFYSHSSQLHGKRPPSQVFSIFRTATLNIICNWLLLKEKLVKPKLKVSNHTINFIKKETRTLEFSCKKSAVFLNIHLQNTSGRLPLKKKNSLYYV